MSFRSSVSAETIVRAIKATIVIEKGIDDPSLRIPLAVSSLGADRYDGNWKIQILAEHAGQDIRASVAEAATKVALSLSLDS